jgi:hypothetical protein
VASIEGTLEGMQMGISKIIDEATLKALQLVQDQEKVEQDIKSAFFGLNLDQIREINQWQATFRRWEEVADIDELVDNLSSEDPDFDKAGKWLESNQDELTPEKLIMIVYAAMLQGVSDYMRKRSEVRHNKNRDKNAQIPTLWEECKTKGMSKNKAKEIIAKKLDLKETTVREKLKGL